jgi:hypothetical protein
VPQTLDILVKDEEKKRKSHDFLTKLKEDLQKVEKMGSDSSAELLRKIASDIEENLETQEIKVKLEGVHNFVQDRIENPFIYGFLDKMKERETGSDVDKRLGMLEDIKSELDHYQDNNSEQGSEAQDFRNTILSLIKSYQASQQELLKWKQIKVSNKHEVTPIFSKITSS